jgi:hypothetical protein
MWRRGGTCWRRRWRTASIKEGGRDPRGSYGRRFERGAHEQLTPGVRPQREVSIFHA